MEHRRGSAAPAATSTEQHGVSQRATHATRAIHERSAWRHSLVARLLGIALGLSLATVAIVATATIRAGRGALRESEIERLATVSMAREGELARWMATQRTQLELLAALPALRTAATALAPADDRRGTGRPDPTAGRGTTAYRDAAAVLREAVRIQRDLREVSILAWPGGRVALSTDPAHEGEYRLTHDTRGFDSTVVQHEYTWPVTGRPALTIATPLRDTRGTRGGTTVAVLAARLDARRLDAILGERTGLGRTGETYLVDPEHRLVSGLRVESDAYQGGVHSAGIDSALAGRTVRTLGPNYAGVPVIGVYRWLPTEQLALVTEMQQAEAFAPAQRIAGRLVLFGVGAASLLALLVWATTRRVVRPIAALTHAAADVARGDLRRALPADALDAPGEVGVLARAFDDMTQHLGVVYGELEAQVAETARAADALRHNQHLLRAILANSSAVIKVKDVDGRYLLVNDAFGRAIGQSAADVVGHADHELFPPALASALSAHDAAVLAAGASHTSELILPLGGSDHVFLATSFPLRDASGAMYATCCIATDITPRVRAEAEHRRLEAQMQHAQRLDALGRLAGGIAHDFNNLLTAIRGNAELALAELEPDTPAHTDVSEIRQVADRAAALTRQLLAFSRKQVLQPQVVDLGQVVGDVERLLRRVLGENIHLVASPDAVPGLVLADRGQLEQVLVNLAVNARDAMPDGGTLHIRMTRTTAAALPPDAPSPPLVDGEMVLLSVADTGAGMDAGTLERAFEPFFTTKPEGRGTGLGLATVYGIVEQSGGSIWIESTLGTGTTVYVALPAAMPAAMPAAAPASAPELAPPNTAPSTRSSRARETILVAEDEDTVRTLASRILRHAGYAVLSARDGREALDVWHTERLAEREIDLLLSDVVMPRSGGRELVRHLRDAAPALPVVLMSGYLEGGAVASDLESGTLFLEKPFTTEALLARVAEALGARQSAPTPLT